MNLHFIAGLPRSGSTLLCNILAQNPDCYSSQTSGLLDVLFGIRNQWDNLIEMRSMDQDLSQQRKLAVMQAVVASFYADVAQPVVFDKSRGWLMHLEMIEWVMQQPVKILVPVRDLRDVLASFEKLWRTASQSRQMAHETQNYLNLQTVEQRCDWWVRGDQPVGLAYNRIKDAQQRGFRDRMHFVDYDKLCRQPERTLDGIYDFLALPRFSHDFGNVEQVTWEDDAVHGMPPSSLHGIRSVVKPQEPQWPKVLGKAADKFAKAEVW